MAAAPTDPTDPKPWWTSKTVWLGVVLTLIGVSSYFAAPEHTPQLTVPSLAAAVGGVAAVVLRVWFTAAPIAGTQVAGRALRARAQHMADAIRGRP